MITTVDNYMDIIDSDEGGEHVIKRKDDKENKKKRGNTETKKLLDYLLFSSLSLTIALAFNDMMLNMLDKITVKRDEIIVQFFYIIFMVIISIILAKYIL